VPDATLKRWATMIEGHQRGYNCALLVIGGKILFARSRKRSCAPAMHRSLRLQNARSRTCWSESGKHNQVGELALSRRKQGFESPSRLLKMQLKWALASGGRCLRV